MHADALRGLGVDLHEGPGAAGSQVRDLPMLGVEHEPVARAGGEHERVLVVQVGCRGRALGWLLEVGHGAQARIVVERRPQLDASRLRVEAGLAVGAQQALLVAAVLEGDVGGRHLLQLLERIARAGDDGAEHLLVVLPRPRLGVEALSQFQVDLHVRFACAHLAHLVDGLAALRAVAHADAVALGIGAGWQEHVGQRHGRGRHEHIHHHDEVERAPGPHGAFGVGGGAGEEVRRLQPGAVQLVGLFGLERFHHLVGGRHLEGELQQGVLVQSDAVRIHLGRDQLAAEPAGVGQDLGRYDHAARFLAEAAYLPQRPDGLGRR